MPKPSKHTALTIIRARPNFTSITPENHWVNCTFDSSIDPRKTHLTLSSDTSHIALTVNNEIYEFETNNASIITDCDENLIKLTNSDLVRVVYACHDNVKVSGNMTDGLAIWSNHFDYNNSYFKLSRPPVVRNNSELFHTDGSHLYKHDINCSLFDSTN